MDLGRYNETKEDFDKGTFKTLDVRDITKSAPYMYNGIKANLEEVIEFYDRGGDVKENLSPFITPLGLSNQEKKALVEFLKSLDGEPILVALFILP